MVYCAPVKVSEASDLTKLPLSIESRVVALTLLKPAPDPLNIPATKLFVYGL